MSRTCQYRSMGGCEECSSQRTHSQTSSSPPAYTNYDRHNVENLHVRIEELVNVGMQAAKVFNGRADLAIMAQLPHPWLAHQLSQPGIRKFYDLYLNDILQIRDWVPHLHLCISDDEPRERFNKIFGYANEEFTSAEWKLQTFIEIMEHFELTNWGVSGWAVRIWNLGEHLRDPRPQVACPQESRAQPRGRSDLYAIPGKVDDSAEQEQLGELDSAKVSSIEGWLRGVAEATEVCVHGLFCQC